MQRRTIKNKSQQNHQKASASHPVTNTDVYELKKEIVLYILKQSLLESGVAVFEMVNRSLFEKYRCEISDCYEKPQYLSDVLKYVYGMAYTKVVESIKKNLSKFSQEDGIKEFVDLLDGSS